MYQGRDPVNGFYIDIKEAEAPLEAWRGVNKKATEKTFIKVAIIRFILRALFTEAAAGVWNNRWAYLTFMLQIKNLKETESYVFRVRAQNKAGVGKTSDVTEPVTAVTKPGERKMSWS